VQPNGRYFLPNEAQKVHGDTAKSHNDKRVRSSIFELTYGIAPAEEVTERTHGIEPAEEVTERTGYSRSAPPPANFP